MKTNYLDRHDHVMRRGSPEGDCPDRLPLPKGQFNPGFPSGISYYCKTCEAGAKCLEAEQGGTVYDYTEVVELDDATFTPNED